MYVKCLGCGQPFKAGKHAVERIKAGERGHCANTGKSVRHTLEPNYKPVS